MQQEIQAAIGEFESAATKFVVNVNKIALSRVSSALSFTTVPMAAVPVVPAVARTNGSLQIPAKAATKVVPKAAAKKAAPKAAAKPEGVKRTPEELAGISGRVEAYIAANPSCGMEQIRAAIGFDTKDLALPIKKLVAEGKLTTEGQKRGTKYTHA